MKTTTQQVIEADNHDLAILVLKDFIIRQKEQLSSARRSSQKAYPNAKQAETVLRAVRNLESGIEEVEKSIQALTVNANEQNKERVIEAARRVSEANDSSAPVPEPTPEQIKEVEDYFDIQHQPEPKPEGKTKEDDYKAIYDDIAALGLKLNR